MEGAMRIDNDVANGLLIRARKGDRESISKFMDAVSGVPNYRLDNHKRQGHIRSTFAKELISDQFLLDIDDIISTFWKGVFEHLDRAKLYGEIVEIKAPGSERHCRPTQNNPIHFLRNHGYMAVRNHIVKLYRRNLEHHCQICGYKAAIKNNIQCPKCNAVMVRAYKFVHEDDVEIESNSITYNDDTQSKLNKLVNDFADSVLGEGTRAYQVIKILVDPSASANMCANCNLCDAEYFDIDTCTNYNANIATWLGVNKTMVASKVRSIRKRFTEFLAKQKTDEAAHLLQMISKRSLSTT